jgi:hypothetical protein
MNSRGHKLLRLSLSSFITLLSITVGQNLAAAAILLRAMPEPSTIEGRRIQGELKNLLEDAAVRRAESSAS